MNDIETWFRARYQSLTKAHRDAFLARLILEFVTINRGYYNDENKERALQFMKGSSELCRRISEQLFKYNNNDPSRYPDSVFVAVVLNHMRVVMTENECATILMRILDEAESNWITN